MQQFTMAWLMLELTDSVSKLGVMVALVGFSRLSLILFMGALADRYDRVHMLIIGRMLLLATMATLATLTFLDAVNVWHLFMAAWVVGAVQAITAPPQISMVRDLVAKEDIMNAVVLNSLVMNLSFMAGPTAAGLLIARAGMAPTLYVITGFLLAGILGLLQIKDLPKASVPSGTRWLGTDILTGFRFVLSSQLVLTVMLLAMAWGFFGQASFQLAPAFAKEVLRLGPEMAGVLLMSTGIGSLTGNLMLVFLGDFKSKNWLLLGGITLFSLAVLAFAFSTTFLFAAACLAVAGLGSLVFDSMVNTTLQLRVPQQMLGRMTSIWFISGGLMFVGALPLGILADAIGLRPAIVGAGVVFMVVVGWLGYVRPTVRKASVGP